MQRTLALAHARPILFMILTITIIAVAFYPIYQGALPKAYATSVNLSLVANVNGWNYTLPSGTNPTITVLETDNVFLSFTASDTQQHQFWLDADKDGLMNCVTRDVCSGVFNSTSPANRGWAAGVIPVGTYYYYDSLHQATTSGTLIVQSGPYPATANIVLYASASGWNQSQPSGPNPTIILRWVQNVNIRYISTDPAGVQHQFYIDLDKNGVPDCSGQDYCAPQFDSATSAGSYWGGSWNFIPPGTYHYYDVNNLSVSNGTFIMLASTPDYYISASPTTLTLQSGKSQTSAIRVSSINNYTGSISLAANPTGVAAALNPSTVTLPKNGIAMSILNVTAPTSISPGNYQVVVTASNGTTQRNTTFSVQVLTPDFTITTNTSMLILIQGSSSTTSVTITSQNGFSGRVSLKAQATPSGPATSQNPSVVNISSGSSQSSTLTVATSPTILTGTYTITVTGNTTSTNGPLTHSVTITLDVNPPPTINPTSPPLSTFLFEAIAAIVLAVSLVLLFARHRAAKRKDQASLNSEDPRPH